MKSKAESPTKLARGGRHTLKSKASKGASVTGLTPAFKPVGTKSISERKREQEFRERAGSTVQNSIMGEFSSLDLALRAR